MSTAYRERQMSGLKGTRTGDVFPAQQALLIAKTSADNGATNGALAPGSPLPTDGSPLEDMVERATNLAQHLEQYQKALASISTCPPVDTRRRLTALFCLAEPVELPREEVQAVSGISPSGLQNMVELDLVRFSGSNVSLTRTGESFLALLYMFSKEVVGGTSQGYLDLVQAVTGGGYDKVFTARLLAGSTLREVRRMQSETSNENPITLAQRRAERDLASARVHKAVDLLEHGLPVDVQAELRHAATELNHAAVHQRQVAARLTRENVCLPQGKRYSDVEEILGKHSWSSFVRMMGTVPTLTLNLPRPLAKVVLEDELIHAFARRRMEPATYETARPLEGAPPPPEAIQLMVNDVMKIKATANWHQAATSARSYRCGVWYANAGKVPPELRALGYEFQWQDSPRVQTPPFQDCPMIVVRRAR